MATHHAVKRHVRSKKGKPKAIPILFGSVGDPNSTPAPVNDPRDVTLIQTHLNTLLAGDYLRPFKTPVPVTGTVDGYTLQLLQRFQQKVGIQGTELTQTRVEPTGNTIKELITIQQEERWAGDHVFRGSFDHATFFKLYAENFAALSKDQQANLDQLLGFMEQDPEVVDIRWMAYMLATTYVEANFRGTPQWKPIYEDGSEKYFTKYDNRTDLGNQGHPDGFTYRGRGYVQLTGRKVYRNVGNVLGLPLETNPDLALEPANAYRIMSYGMRHGTFTGVGLPRYIQGTKCNYVGARAIINGTDRNQEIAGYAETFQDMLEQSVPH